MSETHIDPLYQYIGDLVRTRREEKCLSQVELASRIGMNRVSVINIESGKQRPPLHVLWLIAQVLGFELRDLVPLREAVETFTVIQNPVLESALKQVSPTNRGVVASLFQRASADQ